MARGRPPEEPSFKNWVAVFGLEWPRESFGAHGITYLPAEMNRSELYLAFLPLLNSGRLDLLDNQRMISQFVGLERRTARSGKDSIDHSPMAHDDVANSVAGAICLASVFTAKVPIVAPYIWTKSSLSPAQGGSNQDEYFPSFEMPRGF